MCARQKYADLFLEVLCACAKDTKQKKFLQRDLKRTSQPGSCKLSRASESGCHLQKHFVCEGKRGLDYWLNSCQLSPAKKRCFQMFSKAYHEKWPFVAIDEKDDTWVNSEVHSQLLDWQTAEHDRQTAFSAVQNWHGGCTLEDCSVIFL